MEPTTEPDPVAIRAQLEKILSSALFLRAPFAQRFLRYVVEAELTGSSADIKEYRIGVDVFDRGEDFDPKADTVVRVEGVRLRKRLADYYAAAGASDPIVVEIPKGSYRASFHPHIATTPATVPEPAAPAWPPHRAWIASAVLVVTGAFSAYLLLRDREPFCSWIHNRPCLMNIAVLPFKAIGGDPRDAALAEGLLYVLAGKLSALEGRQLLSVVPAPDVIASGVTASSQARSRLGVNLVFTGSVERGKAGTRVTLSLVNAQTQRQLNAETLDMLVAEPASLQDAVLTAAVRLLEIELNPRIQTVLAAGSPHVPSAQDYYIQGRGFIERGPAGADDAMLLLSEALMRDPNYPLAHAAMAEAMFLKYRVDKERGWIDRAFDSAQTASRLAPDDPDITVVAGVLLRETGKTDEAVAKFRRALQLDSRNGRAQTELAETLELLGRSAEAELAYSHGIEVRPEYWGAHKEMGAFLVRKGRFDEAEARFRRAVQLAPDNPEVLDYLGSAILWGGRPSEAIPLLRKSLLLRPHGSVLVAIAEAHESLGDYKEMVRNLERAVGMSPKSPYPLYALARAYRLAGSAEKSRQLLERCEEVLRSHLFINPAPRITRALWAMTLTDLGRHREAIEQAEQSIAEVSPSPLAVRRVVYVFYKCDRRDRALAALRLLKKEPQELALMRRDVDLAGLFHDPDVGKILGKPDEQRKEQK